jgi:DNA processing protein
MDDATSWLALARMPTLHVGCLGPLLAQGGSPLDLLRLTPAAQSSLQLGRGAAAALARIDHAGIESDQVWLAGRPGRRIVCWGDPLYPARLAAIADAPLVLFVEGNPDVLSRPQLAIVGSRSPTGLGRETAAQFAEHLARAGLVITSGLALGIDAAAHRGALAGAGTTVAVMGRGLDAIYPRENEGLAARIAATGGAWVTDLPTGVGPLRYHFPRRNRILSGLSLGVLVVEAALQSGSLVTARLAAEQGRDVFAIPGSIHSVVSRGCHRLLREGARLVENVDDILAEYPAIVLEHAGNLPNSTSRGGLPGPPSLDKEYEILLDAVGFESAGLDELVARTGFETGAVASMLLILELDGRLQQQPGGRYCRRVPGR